MLQEDSDALVEADRLGRLTDRQRLVLAYIVQHVESHGYPPTLREIGTRMGIGSTNGVSDHLRALERKGYIRRSMATSRGIIVTGGTSNRSMQLASIDAWKAENASLRALLSRVEAAGRRLPGISAEMVVVLGDVRAVLKTEAVH